MGSGCFSSNKSSQSAKVGKSAQDPPSLKKVDEYLYIGNYASSIDKASLETESIKHIVLLYGNQPTAELQQLVDYLIVPIKGGRKTDLKPIIDRVLPFIHKAVAQKENILVSCKDGKNKAAGFVVAYLMARYHLDYEQSTNFLGVRRTIAIKGHTKEYLTATGEAKLREIMNKVS